MTKFGVHVGQQDCTIEELREAWATAEQLGYDWISVWDHFYPSTLIETDPCFEAAACHAALAVTTTRPRVGCLVYSSGFRNPALLANSAVTIDHLSGGRLELGLGAGWYANEYEAYGYPFEAPAVRLRRLREYVEVVRALWTQDVVDHDGEFYTMRSARCVPKPVQSPPRIWIGAQGERMGLRLAGEVGDGWNVAFHSPAEFGRKLEIVRSHAPDPDRLAVGVNVAFVPCDDDRIEEELVNRFGATVEFARPGTLAGSPARMVDAVGAYIEAGAEWVVLAMRAPFDLDGLATFAEEVVPAFAPATAAPA